MIDQEIELWEICAILTYPDNCCESVGCRPTDGSKECRKIAIENGLKWMGEMDHNPNWLHGCFKWYPQKDVDGSQKVYYNDNDGKIVGNMGGHKICAHYHERTRSNLMNNVIFLDKNGCVQKPWIQIIFEYIKHL